MQWKARATVCALALSATFLLPAESWGDSRPSGLTNHTRPSLQRESACYRIHLSTPLESLGFGMWLPESRSFLLSDPNARKLFSMSLDGQMRASRAIESLPVAAVPVDRWDGENLVDREVVVLYSDDQLERFDRALESRGRFAFQRTRSLNGEGHRILSTYSMAANQSFIVGFAALDDLGTQTELDDPGFFAAPIEAPEAAIEVFQIVPGAQDYYRVEHDYLTAIGDDFYFLRLNPSETSPTLYRYRPGSDNPGPFEVTGSSVENQPTPALDLSGVSNFLDLQTSLDRFDGPASLTTSDGLLYITSRAPSDAGTEWTVSTYQPRSESNTVIPLGSTVLPTASANISMIQSASAVFVFEEGPFVTKTGHQDVQEAIVFPKRWIKSPRTSSIKKQSDLMTCPPLSLQ